MKKKILLSIFLLGVFLFALAIVNSHPLISTKITQNNYNFTPVDNLLENAINKIHLDGCVLLLIQGDEVIYEKEIDFGENVNIHRLIKNKKPIYVIWTDIGTVTIDFSSELSGKLKITDGHGNIAYQNSRTLEVNEVTLFIEFHSKDRSVLSYLSSIFIDRIGFCILSLLKGFISIK